VLNYVRSHLNQTKAITDKNIKGRFPYSYLDF